MGLRIFSQMHDFGKLQYEVICVGLMEDVELFNSDGSFYMGNRSPDMRGSRFVLTRLFGDVIYEKYQGRLRH
ncbi:MAG: hypothetical protein CVU11_08850 [Bacteroidetes bacterium HGW-Bacteroidetes-6]|jgi:hypothetical protein|nr:MAG: hypothetical protein CVU11_08850 [Bacteroidetes bacterium HGW-Bacteroidetes-6]